MILIFPSFPLNNKVVDPDYQNKFILFIDIYSTIKFGWIKFNIEFILKTPTARIGATKNYRTIRSCI